MTNRRGTRMLTTLLAVLCALPNLDAQDQPRSLCVAPLPMDAPQAAETPGLWCSPEKLSLQIDKLDRIPWPRAKCVRIEGLDASVQHKVTVLCDRKPQQSFRFRFSEYKSKEPCLFLNDLYKTVQLWEPKGAPWCKCN